MISKPVRSLSATTSETAIANKLIVAYPQLGMIPTVIPPPIIDPPVPAERTPVQQGTDYEYLQEMAARYGYRFYVTPGPAPGTNIAYWGPPNRLPVQRALSVNLGPATNVGSIDFQYDALEPTFVSGRLQDRVTNQPVPVETSKPPFVLTRQPSLSSFPAWLVNQPNVRSTKFRESGLNAMQAYARAQGATDASMDNIVTATGELNALVYGDVLRARGVVGVRGAGFSYSGLYYVKNVTHTISQGEYKQQFTLTRDGLGSLTPVVMP